MSSLPCLTVEFSFKGLDILSKDRFSYVVPNHINRPEIANSILNHEAVLSVGEDWASRVLSVYPIDKLRLVKGLPQSYLVATAYPMNRQFVKSGLGKRALLACAIFTESGLRNFWIWRYDLNSRSLRALSVGETSLSGSSDEAFKPIDMESFITVIKPALVGLLTCALASILTRITLKMQKFISG